MIRGLIRQLDRSWRVALVGFMRSRDGIATLNSLDTLLVREQATYHPAREDVFAAFRATHFNDVRVVIIGQDPYPNPDYATGLAFSMPDDETDFSSSIKKIHCAIKRDLEEDAPAHGNLNHWARQGVLLLNRVLTYRLKIQPNNPDTGQPSTKKENADNCKEWRDFTQAVVQALARSGRPIQFILWGEKAQEIKLPDYPECLIHKAPHPTPRTALLVKKFRNCQHFSQVNDILVAMGDKPIDWIKDPNQ